MALRGTGSAPRLGGGARRAKSFRFAALIWFLLLVLCAALAAVSFKHFDVQVARRVYGIWPSSGTVATGLGSDILLSIEAAVVLGLVVTRIRRGHLSPFREAVVLACLASICGYAINDGTLKFIFGVPNPWAVLHGAGHAFHFLGGSPSCGFPSGHMVLAGAFAGVFMRLYRRSILPLSALLLIASVLLVLGDWHFLSDILAGAFVGITAGLLAGELWLVHSSWAESSE